MLGQTISHYKILEKLGEGGMGVVYKAQDTKLDRFVALKFLPSHLSTSEEEKKRFIHEAKAASALNHPNIATIYEIDEADGQMFIAMEFIDGQSLQEILNTPLIPPQGGIKGGVLNLRKVLNYAIQIAQGLAKAHEKGIIHRDIKPANILVTEDGVAKIVDFGLAKLSGRTMLTKEGTTMGTVAYMSPEQTQGAKVDHRSDIWALGVMMYEMMTRQLPFKGDYEQAVIYSILNEDPEPITSLESRVGEDFDKLIQKALRKNQNERYQTLDDLTTDLRSLRKELGANKTESLKNNRRAIGKFPLLYYGTAAVIITVIAVIFSFFSTRQAPIDSIAVLPIQNLSGDPAQEYFSDGMTDALIGHLGSIKALRVISRTSIMQYKNTTKSVKQIADELEVSHVVEGSVLRVKDRVRISTQLIDAAKDQQIWGHSYERELTDILMMQSEVATAIANEIKVTMTPGEQQRLTSQKPIKPEAYNAYLQGRFYWNKRTGDGLRRGIEHFEQAIAIDPNFAEAYAGLADCYNIIGHYGSVSPKESVPKGKAAAFRAVEIDESLAEAHTSLALAHFMFDHDWLTAEKEFIRAIELNPNYPTAHHWYALYLAAMRRPHEAMTEMKKAQDLDPLSLIINAELGWMLYFARDYDQAIEQCKKTLMLDPSFAVAHWTLGLAYTQKSMYERAINAFQEAVDASDRATYTLTSLGYAYAVSGQKSEAQKILDEIREASNKYISPMDMAFIYTGLGMKDQAFDWLYRAYEERSSNFPIYLSVGPRLDDLRRDPRFDELLSKVGLEK